MTVYTITYLAEYGNTEPPAVISGQIGHGPLGRVHMVPARPRTELTSVSLPHSLLPDSHTPVEAGDEPLSGLSIPSDSSSF